MSPAEQRAAIREEVRRLNPEWLSVKQLAAWLDIGRVQAYELVASGVLPHIRVGTRTLRVRFDVLRKFLIELESDITRALRTEPPW